MKQRVERLRERLQHHNLNALLVSSLTNIRYLFGFCGSNAIALVASDLSFFITDRRYTLQASQQVHGAEIVIAKKDLYAELKKIVSPEAGYKIGVEAMHLSLKDFTQLKKALDSVKLVASERLVERISAVKDAQEIEDIRQAATICTAVFNETLPLIKPGISELDISAEISYRAARRGSERDPFEPIVASGVRSALPHGMASRKKIAAGDLVILDFGATMNGYAADFTRTVIVGEASPEQRKMADAVAAALDAAEQATKPGVGGKELDGVARSVLAEKGLGEYFQHSLGHGLGLNVHELPRIGERSQDVLAAGNVVALEPGVYLPEVGGIRIEDDFVLTSDGAENLTPISREVVCVGQA